MFKVTIPATTANLGPGFDCIGAALNLYNSIEVEEINGGGLEIESSGTWKIMSPNENNLVYKSMKAVFEKIKYTPTGLKIILKSEIPNARGLGSSAACIAGGLFAANVMTNQQLSKEELIEMAANIEGHPDNTTPAILGGLVVSVLEEGKLYYVKLDIPSNLKFAVFIPDFTLSTVKARMVLPERINFRDGVFNLGRSALLIASLLEGKTENLSCAFKDKLHQPYRKKLIPNTEEIFEQSMKNGANGCYISGAGPSLMALVDNDNNEFYEKMTGYLKTLETNWKIKILELDKKGIETFVN